MVVIEVRHRQGGEADEEEKEKEEKEEKEEKRKAADIKSNNPHLAGGEKQKPFLHLSLSKAGPFTLESHICVSPHSDVASGGWLANAWSFGMS